MKLSKLTLSGILSATALVGVKGNPVLTSNDLEAQGYTIVPVTITTPLSDGQNLTIKGTIQDVYKHLHKFNSTSLDHSIVGHDSVVHDERQKNITTPVFLSGRDVAPNGTVQGVHNHTAHTAKHNDVAHERREDTHVKCNVPYPGCRLKGIGEGIDYLRASPANCYVDAGPRVCARVSCAWKAAIFFCNDNDHPLSVKCSHLATDLAQPIIDNCVGSGLFKVSGQCFDSENYNILLAYAKC